MVSYIVKLILSNYYYYYYPVGMWETQRCFVRQGVFIFQQVVYGRQVV